VGAGKEIPDSVKQELGEVKGKTPDTFVASLKWHIMCEPRVGEPLLPIYPAGLEMIPFPVLHGKEYLSLGFAMGKTNKKFVYISDVSDIPPAVMQQLKEWEVDYLVIDSLHPSARYPSHLCLEDAIGFIEEIAPRKTLLVGVSHRFDHDAANADLAKMKQSKGLDIQIAYDGQKIDLDDLDI